MMDMRTRLARRLIVWFAGPMLAALPSAARAQSAAPPPPLWDAQVGASFVGTSGNSETSSAGADFALHRRWPVWQIESAATAVRTSDHDVRTAERYLGLLRGQRKLSALLGLSTGVRLERDRFSGMDLRSIVDAGLSWALVRRPRWTLDGITALAWNHEKPVDTVDRDTPAGVFQLASRVPFSAAAETMQRFTYYPDFKDTDAYRSEAELAVQAAMTNRLALKVGYLWRFSNAPVAGFKKVDNLATASVVLRWKAATAAP
jgi:putative salt-induced outer membrane protein YdiY